MSTSKLIKKFFKLKSKKKDGDYNTTLPATPSASSLASTTPQQLPQHLSPASNTVSAFLSLPGEIRNQIYNYAIYASLFTISIHHHPSTVLCLPIFHISHQIRAEALSHFCSTKSFYFDGIVVANGFFNIIGADVMPDLRVITIRDQDWIKQDGEVGGAREELLAWLELATSLKQLDYVIGTLPSGVSDTQHIESASSPGVRWVFKIRDKVDNVDFGADEAVMKERFERLSLGLGRDQAIASLCAQLMGENEMSEDKVFRLHRVVSLEGKTEELRLPFRKPGFMRGLEEGRGTECGDGRNEEQRLQFGAPALYD